MNRAIKPWPPLVVAQNIPRVVKWRDAILTSLMWLFFVLLLATEFELFLGDYLERLGFGPFDTAADWPLYLELLMPYLLVTAVLVAALVTFAVQTLRRRSSALALPQPAPLDVADQSGPAGLDASALTAARERRIVTVHVEPDGSCRLEASPAIEP
jgi:poly-beta-1,6-N-acetyl-D-glucosamine biosynthesis protein PgaD